jgi:hypothetical protein
MRLVLATKREVQMGDRKPLFFMNAKQAQVFAQLVEAANRGDGAAACQLGDLYRQGKGGLRQNPAQTFRWYARSALTGDANGQNNLGACYEHGIGCAQSYRRAFEWYARSSAQGLGTASMNLAYCYLRGTGTTVDKREALRLFQKGFAEGEDRCKPEIDRLVPLEPEPRRRSIRFVDETHLGSFFGLTVGGGGRGPGRSGPHTVEDRHGELTEPQEGST